jgi:dUTP pyrophosphatase
VLNTPGTIDSGYRGEIGVILYNTGFEPFEVNVGDRIAQLVIQKFETAEFELVDVLSETERGDGGFGSSGTN